MRYLHARGMGKKGEGIAAEILEENLVQKVRRVRAP
jgi:hypothetical protein